MNLKSMSVDQLYYLKLQIDTQLRSHGMKVRSNNDKYFRYCSHCNRDLPLNSDYFYMKSEGQYYYLCKVGTQLKNKVNSQSRRDFLKTRKNNGK